MIRQAHQPNPYYPFNPCSEKELTKKEIYYEAETELVCDSQCYPHRHHYYPCITHDCKLCGTDLRTPPNLPVKGEERKMQDALKKNQETPVEMIGVSIFFITFAEAIMCI